ncbi:MAG: DUF1572 domain-containing protein [Planctomycetes bacterium]|nr:DUF1572 domain-containing protein [Planctomycetota bacterium]
MQTWFTRESARYLRDVYLPRLRKALDTLPESDLWWRPHGKATSIGNLLLHLEGNIRQWILVGLGGAPDRRRRAEEFARRDGGTKAGIMDALAATLGEAARVVESQIELDRRLVIQGFETSPREAIYHVVEHLSWHTGQIVWIAKMRAGETHGIAFYDDRKLDEPGRR